MCEALNNNNVQTTNANKTTLFELQHTNTKNCYDYPSWLETKNNNSIKYKNKQNNFFVDKMFLLFYKFKLIIHAKKKI